MIEPKQGGAERTELGNMGRRLIRAYHGVLGSGGVPLDSLSDPELIALREMLDEMWDSYSLMTVGNATIFLDAEIKRRADLNGQKQDDYEGDLQSQGRCNNDGSPGTNLTDPDPDDILFDHGMRPESVITAAVQKLFQWAWLLRPQYIVQGLRDELIKCDPEVLNRATLAAEKISAKYGEEDRLLGDLDFGILLGNLAALRWVLGKEWPLLDD